MFGVCCATVKLETGCCSTTEVVLEIGV